MQASHARAKHATWQGVDDQLRNHRRQQKWVLQQLTVAPPLFLVFPEALLENISAVSRTLSNEDGLLGFYLQEIELVCSENHVPGLPTCSSALNHIRVQWVDDT